MPTTSLRSAAAALRQAGPRSSVSSRSVMAEIFEASAVLLFGRDLHEHRDLILGEALATMGIHSTFEEVERLRLLQVEARGDDLPHHRMGFAEDGYLAHVVERQKRVFDLRRIHLLAADVDEVGGAPEDAQ